jgi:hypothetical protein
LIKIFIKLIKYEDQPHRVDDAFEHYTQIFCDQLGDQFPYTQQQLKHSLLKIREIRQKGNVNPQPIELLLEFMSGGISPHSPPFV